jgi:plasmid stabilization system protein ParE
MTLRVRLSRAAKAQLTREDVWWQTYRTKAPDAFWDEFSAAVAMLREFPDAGVRVRGAMEGLRAVTLPISRYRVFYWVDEELGRLRIEAIWSAQRVRRPALPKRRPR